MAGVRAAQRGMGAAGRGPHGGGSALAGSALAGSALAAAAAAAARRRRTISASSTPQLHTSVLQL
jgi:hypothetical protein